MKSSIRYITAALIFLCAIQARSESSNDNYQEYIVQKMQVISHDNDINDKDFYNGYLGKNVNMQQLDREIYDYLVERDYVAPQIYIDKEALKKGLLNVEVARSNIENVIIHGDNTENELIDEYIKQILADRPSKMSTVEKYMALLNRIPGYYVQYEFRPSETEGNVDLLLYFSKDKGDVYLSADSYGETDFGQMQNIASAQIYSPSGGNDSLGAYGMITNHPDRFYLVGATYSRIINLSGTSLNFAISHSESNSSLEDIVVTKDGVTNIFQQYFSHPLYLSERQSLDGEIGVAYKSSKGYIADVDIVQPTRRGARPRDIIFPYQRLDTEDNYSLANATLRYSLSDKAGGFNTLALSFSQAINGSYVNNTTPSDVPDKHFNVVSLNGSRDHPLPNDFSIYSTIVAGHSDYTLPGQELFFLGGREYGRGYEAGVLSGNKVLAASLELRCTKELEESKLFRVLQPYVFRDMGYVGKQLSTTSISHINSYGAGLRTTFIHGIQLDVEIAQPIEKSYVIEGVEYKSYAVIGIIGSKVFRF